MGSSCCKNCNQHVLLLSEPTPDYYSDEPIEMPKQINKFQFSDSQQDLLHQTLETLQDEESFQNIQLGTMPNSIQQVDDARVLVELCLLYVSRFEQNQQRIGGMFDRYQNFLRKCYSMVSIMEPSLRALAISKDECNKLDLLRCCLLKIITINYIIKHLEDNKYAWWLKEQVLLEENLINENSYLYLIMREVEQDFIRLGGLLKYEVYRFHRNAVKQVQFFFQREYLFKHKASKLINQAIKIRDQRCKNDVRPRTLNATEVTQ